MSERLTGEIDREEEGSPQKKYPRHPITMENTPEETIKRMQGLPERAAKLKETIRNLNEETDQNRQDQDRISVRRKHPRHPITMENTPEETIRRMRAFPERAAKLREIVRVLREADAR
ncbi:MAG: hypothetical protein ACXW3C_12755 [Pyrinomonadaceae bacterium]